MLKLYGRPNSINVQKALFCVEDLGIEYELVLAGRGHGVSDTPEFLAMNPNGLVPVIDDDGFILWESNAIVRYLSAKHGAGTLWPDDLPTRASADRWMDWQTTGFSPAYGPAFYTLIRVPEPERDPAQVEAGRKAGEAAAKILDSWLGDHRFVAGDTFTMGDIAIGAAVHRWLNLPLERKPAANLERYYGEVMERASAQKALPLPVT
ncbi:glutathione S-transferase family protein [Afifella sp. IM 167]|uniref:glutathione S-transferase family protein n=1 Tax=Afifella sp. IM 167 TaxID=2033586 RepID=UPI001CCCE296|nr:glutathione S-transferase family protein [Afifella sp. IM 167]MBZ8132645.1 glutathione S-transferase [Afifella sp. IM 167]